MIFALLFGCVSYYQPEETEFYTYLKNNYENYGNYKKENYDWKMARKFYKKVKKIENGRVVLPEGMPKNISEEDLFAKKTETELKNMRDRMYLILNNSASKVDYAEEVASLQLYYDCWLLEGDLYKRYGQISRCKQGFVDTLSYLEFKLLRLSIDEQTLVRKEIDDQLEDRKPFVKPKKYVIYFDFDSSVVDEQATRIIWNLLDDVKKIEGNYILNIVGHADRIGDLKYNKKLSKRRTDTIKYYLIKNGICKENIKESWLGEIDPRVITSNEYKEEVNRRVVITIDKIN